MLHCLALPKAFPSSTSAKRNVCSLACPSPSGWKEDGNVRSGREVSNPLGHQYDELVSMRDTGGRPLQHLFHRRAWTLLFDHRHRDRARARECLTRSVSDDLARSRAVARMTV